MIRNCVLIVLIAVSVLTIIMASNTVIVEEESSLRARAVEWHEFAFAAMRYLILHDIGQLPFHFRAAIICADGEIIKEMPQIGVTVTRSSNPDFVRMVRRIPYVYDVIPDRIVRLVPLPTEPIFGYGLFDVTDEREMRDYDTFQERVLELLLLKSHSGERSYRNVLLRTGIIRRLMLQ